MSILKYIGRLKHMDDLINRKATGTPEEFAQKLGICKSMLMLNLSEIKELGASIKYDARIHSYYYEKQCRLEINYKHTTENDLLSIKGGMDFFDNYSQSNNIRIAISNFGMHVI